MAFVVLFPLRLRAVLIDPDSLAENLEDDDGPFQSDRNGVSESKAGNSPGTAGTTRRSLSPSFWQSPLGQDSLANVPHSAPPLDLRPWNWQESDMDEDSFQRVPTDPPGAGAGAGTSSGLTSAGNGIPQGSAMQAIRSTKK